MRLIFSTSTIVFGEPEKNQNSVIEWKMVSAPPPCTRAVGDEKAKKCPNQNALYNFATGHGIHSNAFSEIIKQKPCYCS